MTNFLKYCCIVVLLLLFTQNLFGQLDSNKIKNEAVKQEMTAMFNKINVFLAEQSPNQPNMSLYVELNNNWNKYKDSVANALAKQQQEINELKGRLKALEDKKVIMPEVITKKFDNIIGVLYFEVGSFALSEENKMVVKKVVQNYGNKTLQLVAYTDWTGNDETNQKLSEQRALAVQNELTNNGFQIQDLKTYSRGKMAEENEKLSAKECRRVEIRY